MFVLCRSIEYHHAAAAMCQCFHVCQSCPRGPYSRLWQVAAGRPFLFFLYVLSVDSSVCNTMAVSANMFMRYSLHFTDAKLSSRYYNIVVFLLHNDDIYIKVQMMYQSPADLFPLSSSSCMSAMFLFRHSGQLSVRNGIIGRPRVFHMRPGAQLW